jgi:hypothetical protein
MHLRLGVRQSSSLHHGSVMTLLNEYGLDWWGWRYEIAYCLSAIARQPDNTKHSRALSHYAKTVHDAVKGSFKADKTTGTDFFTRWAERPAADDEEEDDNEDGPYAGSASEDDARTGEEDSDLEEEEEEEAEDKVMEGDEDEDPKKGNKLRPAWFLAALNVSHNLEIVCLLGFYLLNLLLLCRQEARRPGQEQPQGQEAQVGAQGQEPHVLPAQEGRL